MTLLLALTFEGKAKSLSVKRLTDIAITRVGSIKYWALIEMSVSEKPSSLLQKDVNYNKKVLFFGQSETNFL